MSTILHVITRSEFIEKYQAPFPGLDQNRLTNKTFNDIDLDEIAQVWGYTIPFGSGLPSKLIFQDGAMSKYQGDFMYSGDGNWYIIDGEPIPDTQDRKPSVFGTGILIPDYVKRVYNINVLGKKRKGIIPIFQALDTDGMLISLPNIVYPESIGRHYLLKVIKN